MIYVERMSQTLSKYWIRHILCLELGLSEKKKKYVNLA